MATASAATVLAAHQRERLAAERALADLFASELPLFHRRQDVEPVWLLFVSLESLYVAAELANTRLQIRLRYGGTGIFQEKYSQKVRSSAPNGQVQDGSVIIIRNLVNAPELNGTAGICERWSPQAGRWIVRLKGGESKPLLPQNLQLTCSASADFGAMMVFRWNPKLPPAITLSLTKLGFVDSIVSNVRIQIPFREGVRGVAEQELLFERREDGGCCLAPRRSKDPQPSGDGVEEFVDHGMLGHLGVAVKLQRFMPEELQLGMSGSVSLQELVATLDLLTSPALAMVVAAPPLRRSGGIVSEPPILTTPPVHGIPMDGMGYSGATPVVMGRPIPATGWQWNGPPYRR